jgi:hypothetical protein
VIVMHTFDLLVVGIRNFLDINGLNFRHMEIFYILGVSTSRTIFLSKYTEPPPSSRGLGSCRQSMTHTPEKFRGLSQRQ